ncbi:MAG: VCBS repeat-containing protein, partial [Thiotrichales bacterium]|nr:VCBS repeat-containing protein [Thiotrichales bacterium]
DADTTFINSTVAQNESLDSAQGSLHFGAIPADANSDLTAYNSIFAENKAGGLLRDVTATFNPLSSHNLISSTSASGAAGGLNDGLQGNLVGKDPMLGELANHGGLTQTHALLPGSQAINAGDNSQALDATGGSLVQDQRGFPRDLTANNPTDIGAFELSQHVAGDVDESPVVIAQSADFNGDSRPDQLHYDPSTSSLNVVLGADDTPTTALWGILGAIDSWDTFKVGDFNGDGRDDVWAYDSVNDKWRLALSEGTSFSVPDADVPANNWFATLPNIAWAEQFVGDFDGDGSEELLGRTATDAAWQLVQFDELDGTKLETNWGASLTSDPALNDPFTIYVGDVNRDGWDDLIGIKTAGNWVVSISQGPASTFTSNQPWTGWFDDHLDPVDGSPIADGPYQEIIDIFSNVYNNVELELYPGLMKGIQATEDTQAGNPWDQAALLVDKLEKAGFHAEIATGLIEADSTELEKWLGVDSSFGVAQKVINQSLDGNSTLTLYSNKTTVTFTHAWVRALVPGASDLQWVDLDPSWKFRQQLDGIAVDLGGARGTFDEFEYLTLDPENDERLPVEFYEDQVQQYLVENHPGSSLADVLRTGPIITQVFDTIPAGLGEGVAVVDVNLPGPADDVATYNNAQFIYDDPALSEQFTHRFQLDLDRGTNAQTNSNLVIPSENNLSSYSPLDQLPPPPPLEAGFSSTANFNPYTGLVQTTGIETVDITVPINGSTILAPYGNDPSTSAPPTEMDFSSQTLEPYYPLEYPNSTLLDFEGQTASGYSPLNNSDINAAIQLINLD